jgi:Big-like domain-containing protein
MAQINVGAGQNPQTVVDTCPSGSTLALEAGATFVGPIILPPDKPLTLQSSRLAEIAPDKRVSPDDAGKMPKLIAPVGDRAIKTASRAREIKLLGLEVTHDPLSDIHTLIALGDGDQTVLEDIPHTLTLERMFIHGHADRASVRGVALNSASTDILNTYISDIHSADVDSQAICGWAGPGPFRILDGYFEAAGENIMFGGADPKIAGLIPSDIDIRRSHCFKPLSWKVGHPTYAGRDWSIKNLFETKNLRRAIVEGNIFENNWTDSQAGSGIVIKCNNQDSTAPWSVTEDLLFQYNTVISEAGLNLLMIENLPKVSAIGKRNYFRHCLFIVERLPFQGPVNGEDIQIEHITWIINRGQVFELYGQPTKDLKFNNNLGWKAEYGVRSDAGEGTAAFEKYAIGWQALGNVIAGADAARYPTGNFFPATMAEVKLGADYKLAADSPYKGKATDGTDPGCDMDALLAAQAGNVVSLPPTTPTEPPVNSIPIVTVTSPANGTTVSGTITVTATVTNAEVGDVYLMVEDVTSGHVTAAPYEFKLDTSKLTEGNHSLWVRAWNKTGQAGDSASITVTVKNAVVVVPETRRVAFPSGEAKQNAILDAQWKDGYRMKRHLAGAFAEFEKVK